MCISDWSADVCSSDLPATDDHLKAPFLVSQLASALAVPFGTQPQIRFDAAQAAAETLHACNERQRDERQASAESTFLADPQVQRLMSTHGAELVPDSIRPHHDQRESQSRKPRPADHIRKAEGRERGVRYVAI